VPNINVRSWRAMIEFRQKLLGRRTAVKNQLRAILRGHGIKAPRNLWYGPGLNWLKSVSELDSFASLQRDMLLEELSELENKIKRVEKELAKIASTHPAVTLLMTIPGVGIRTAEAVCRVRRRHQPLLAHQPARRLLRVGAVPGRFSG
jgi:transposase